MPSGYPVPYEDNGSVGEQLLGRGDAKRSTKTFIEDGPLAMFLGMFRGLPDSIMNTARRLHAEEFNMRFEDVTPALIFETYPEAQELISIHQNIIEHKGSQSGYLVDRYVSKATTDSLDKQPEKKESSGEFQQKVSKRWT